MPKVRENIAFKEIIKGGLLGAFIFFIISLLVCLLIFKLNLSSNLNLPLLIISSLLSGLLGGYFSVRKNKEKGLICGIISSIIPSLAILTAMSFSYKGFSVYEFLIIAFCMLGSVVGGVAGVNIKKKRKTIKKR